jgi:glycerol-3-phosphate cytidylyltransferase
MKRVLTYGTFDLLHYGHIRLLKRAKELGDYLIVGLSTDEFNEIKHKKSYHNYETRKIMLEAIRYVDLVIPENSWDQKINDVIDYHVDTVVMGSDWKGSDKFEYLSEYCQLKYLDRTQGVSTSMIKKELGLHNPVSGVFQLPEERKNEKIGVE